MINIKVTLTIIFIISCIGLSAQVENYNGSFSFNYTGVKYTARQSMPNTSKSDSKQFLAGIAKEMYSGLRLGLKTGLTIDKVYSSFDGVNNRSETNTQIFLGINFQKRLLSAFNKKAGVWLNLDISVEPYIQKGSNFSYFLQAASPADRLLLTEMVYHDKKNRTSLTPSFKFEFPVYKDINFFASFGYSIDLSKSNRRVFFRGLPGDFTGIYQDDAQFSEGFLFSGVGLSMQIFKPKQ